MLLFYRRLKKTGSQGLFHISYINININIERLDHLGFICDVIMGSSHEGNVQYNFPIYTKFCIIGNALKRPILEFAKIFKKTFYAIINGFKGGGGGGGSKFFWRPKSKNRP